MPTPSSSAAPPALRVMVIDDHPHAAELLCEMLGLEGHTAVGMLDAATALAACEHQQFDLMLIDLTLPDLPGAELARRVRAASDAQPERVRPMLVAVSGYGRDATAAADAVDQFDEFLPKPVDFDALDRLLARCAAQLAA